MRQSLIKLTVIAAAILSTMVAGAQQVSYVDLGLSVKWATINYGVSSDTPYGGYYTWTYAQTIRPADGSRLASKAEWDELRDYCSWKWTTVDGIDGFTVTSKIKGYTNSSIFIPAAGWLQDGRIEQKSTYASYWTSTPGVQPGDAAAYGFNFTRKGTEWHSENRASEQSVRMVMPLLGSEVKGLSISRSITMTQGTSTRLDVTMSRGRRNVNSACLWSSSDDNIIKVWDDGLIVAVAPGTCTVTAAAYGKTTTCSVTVTPHEYEYVDLGLSVM